MHGLPFSCGAQLQDSDLPDYLKEIVFVCKLACEYPVERLYHSVQRYMHTLLWSSGSMEKYIEPFYPQCKACDDKGKIPI